MVRRAQADRPGVQADNLTDWAAALTYYGILALFPVLLVLVAVLGLIGESATQPLLDTGRWRRVRLGDIHERDRELHSAKAARASLAGRR